jgi:stringent starvation protein A
MFIDMTALANRRSVMTLYADAADPLGHSVRLVLMEKDINVEIHFIDEDSKPEDLNDLNILTSVIRTRP